MLNNIPANSASSDAKQYQAMKNRLFLLNTILNFLFLSLLILTGVSKLIKERLLFLSSDFLFINALYFSVFAILAFCLSFPFEFYEGFILEHKYKLSRQRFSAWLKDVLKKSVIGFIVSLIMVEAVYFFLLNFEKNWWLWASLFWFILSIVLTRIFPKFILPLFFKSKPLEPGILKDMVLSLFKKINIKIKDVYILDFSKKTVKANAMVAGIGGAKQIFLSDTLVSGFAPEEIQSVLAHELGHYIHRDTLKLVLVSLAGALFSFYSAAILLNLLIPVFGFTAISDIAGMPLFLIVLLLAGLIQLPIQNSFSRFIEKKADLFALEQTQNPSAFISMMQKLGEKNFSDFSPSKIVKFFLYDHPPIEERIKLAQSAKVRKDNEEHKR